MFAVCHGSCRRHDKRTVGQFDPNPAIDAFNYEKFNWARQTEAMEAEIKRLTQKLNLDKRYTSTLKEYCGDAGFPVAAIKEAVISSTGLKNYGQNDSKDEDFMLITRRTKTQEDTD